MKLVLVWTKEVEVVKIDGEVEIEGVVVGAEAVAKEVKEGVEIEVKVEAEAGIVGVNEEAEVEKETVKTKRDVKKTKRGR